MSANPVDVKASSNDLFSAAIEKYKMSMEEVRLTGKVTKAHGKLLIMLDVSAGTTPIGVEVNQADVLGIKQDQDDPESLAVVSLKRDSVYKVTIAGVAGYEQDLPSGLRHFFGSSRQAFGGGVR